MERIDSDEGATRGNGRGRVGRVGDDPLLYTLGMITIGLVLGIYVGLLMGNPTTGDGPGQTDEALRGELDALSKDVLMMTAIVDELDARSYASAEDLAVTRTRLDLLSEDLVAIGSTLQEVRDELDRRQGPIDGASEDLGDLRVELLDVRMELVNLQLELDDLIAQIIAGGGSGGGSPQEEPKPLEQRPMSERTGSAPTQISSPYSRGGQFSGRNFGGGGASGVGEAAASQGGRLRYQPMGGAGAGGAGAATPPGASRMGGGPGGGGPPAPGGPAGPNLGLPVGIAAASPFVALLGKALTKKSDDD